MTKYIVPIAMMSIAFMLLMPYGTFNPSELGFYMSIINAVLIGVVTPWLINRFRAKKDE
jgi:FtsH-binding integral membrane protein